MRPALFKQLAPLKLNVVCAERALEIARLVSQEDVFQVAILPAASSHAESWAIWGEVCLIDPRPEILVYSQVTSFQLWTAVLDMGGFDVIVQPFRTSSFGGRSSEQSKVLEKGRRGVVPPSERRGRTCPSQ